MDDVGETDIIVTETMNITAIANKAFFTTEVRELIDFSEIQFRAQKEASELKTAKAEERIRREAREAEAREIIPAAREPTKPVQFKAADVPKPAILTFNCTWKTWDEEKKKLIHFYSQAYKPVPHPPAEQQGIFLSFLDSTLTEELNVKFIDNPDADWKQCIKFVDEKMQVQHPIIGRRLKVMEMTQNETEGARGFITRLKLSF